MADNDPAHPKLVVVAVVHHISWATARAGPSKHVGCLMATVDVVVAVVHYISWAARSGPARQNTWDASWAGRSGPYRAHILWAAARSGPSIFERMDRGPARPINFSEDGSQHDPAHQNFRGWAAARPKPSQFQFFTARPITFSKVSARPGPARHNFQIGPAWPGPDKRPMTSRALNKYFKTDEKKWHYCDGCPAQFCELRPDFFTSYVNPM